MCRETGQGKHPFSLGYPKRLHERHQFVRFFENSFVTRLNRCTVFRIPNAEGHFRLGITLKIKCSSVERNQLKRTVREGFRKIAPRLGDYDYNVVIRRFDRPMALFCGELAREISERLRSEHFKPVEPKRVNSA